MKIRQRITNGRHSKNMEMSYINIILFQILTLMGFKLRDQNITNIKLSIQVDTVTSQLKNKVLLKILKEILLILLEIPIFQRFKL